MAGSVSNDSSDAQAVREYYKEREQTLKEQHRKEIAKMQEAHRTEVQSNNEKNDSRINQASKDTQATIQKQDLRHQREIAKMREAHASQLRRESLQRTKNEDHLHNTYQDQLEQKQRSHDAQLLNQREKSRQTISGNNASTSETLAAYQKRHHQESVAERARLNRTHQIEKQEMNARHRDTVDRLKTENQFQKLSDSQQTDSLKQKHQYQIEGLQRQQKMTLEDTQYQNAETMKNMREEHDHAVKGIQKRYNLALAEEKAELEETRKNYYSQNGRVAQERDRQNQKIRRLREDNVRNMARKDTEKRRELDNLREADKAAYDTLVNERREMVKEFNRIHGEEIRTAQINADQRIVAHQETQTKKMEKLNERHKFQMTDQRRKLITENNDRKKANELHVEQVQNDYKNDRERLLLMQKTEKERIGDRYQSNLEQIRFKDQMQRDKMRADFGDKIKDMDLRHKKELIDQKQGYEKQIAELKNRQQQQIVAMKRESDRIQMERDQATKMREANREAKFRHVMKNRDAQHSDQIAQMNESYRQNLTDLIREGQRIEKGKS